MKPPVPVLLLFAVATSACANSSAKTAEAGPSGLPIRTAVVEQRDLIETLVLTGTLRPRQQVEVPAEVAARLLRVAKDEGAWVRDGEVLAELDATDFRLSNERALAALAVAEANRAHALVERERADNLKQTGGITGKDHLSAQVNLQVSEAALAQAKAEAAIAGQTLARAQVKAPFAGRVARRHADAGAMLAAGTPLFTLVDDRAFEFRASVPSADFAKVRVGAAVEVTVDGSPGRPVQGRLARLAPLIDERTRSFEVVVEVPSGRELVGGLFARAKVRVGAVAGALVVPPGALVRDGGAEAQVYRVAAGKAERLSVKLGVEDAQAVQVSEGLAAGDVVVLDPPAALASGTAVLPQAPRGN